MNDPAPFSRPALTSPPEASAVEADLNGGEHKEQGPPRARTKSGAENVQSRAGELDCDDLAKVNENSNLTDGRKRGEFTSLYPCCAWLQIGFEFAYLAAILILLTLCLLDPALSKSQFGSESGTYTTYFLQLEIKNEAVRWIALTISGMLGGTIFCLKWLYHSVAKGAWHRDRLLWRIVVPFNSALVALFTGFLFGSGAVPFLKDETLDTPIMAVSFGFIFGYFSDNILAALQNFAHKIFGTLGKD